MHRSDDHAPTTYEIRLAGHLDARWATRFDGLVTRHEADGTTVLSGPIVDQAALHGLLQRVRDLGVPLISVTRREVKLSRGLQAESPNQEGDPTT